MVWDGLGILYCYRNNYNIVQQVLKLINQQMTSTRTDLGTIRRSGSKALTFGHSAQRRLRVRFILRGTETTNHVRTVLSYLNGTMTNPQDCPLTRDISHRTTPFRHGSNRGPVVLDGQMFLGGNLDKMRYILPPPLGVFHHHQRNRRLI